MYKMEYNTRRTRNQPGQGFVNNPGQNNAPRPQRQQQNFNSTGGQYPPRHVTAQTPGQQQNYQKVQGHGFQQNNQPQRQPPATLPPAPLKSALKKDVKTDPQSVQKPAIVQHRPLQQTPAIQIQKPVQATATPPQPLQNEEQKIQIAKQLAQQQIQLELEKTLKAKTEEPMDISESQDTSMENDNVEENGIKKKTLFFKGKISKKEKRGRRNKRLRKILMPKNALMILNELAAGHKFTFIEKEDHVDPSGAPLDPDIYVASVTIDTVEHIGYGKSKINAKNAAAEVALRHIILSKIGNAKQMLNPSNASSGNESDGEKPLEIFGGDPVANPSDEDEVSWIHVASYAMHKLFANWLQESDETKILAKAGVPDLAVHIKDVQNLNKGPKPRRPAKQLPANPELLNPVMLLNQMRDDIVYEEFMKEGNPPAIIFTYKTVVDGMEFYGRGGNKKIARRNCAYAACIFLYNVTYPSEDYDPSTTSCQPVSELN